MNLRPYQEQAIEAIFAFFAAKGNKTDTAGTPIAANPVVCLPTGTGKALCVAELCRRAIEQYPQTRIIVGIHSQELVEQNTQELLDHWPTAPVGVYCAGLRRKDTHNQIIIGSIDSMVNCVELFGIRHLVIIDECHMVSPVDNTRYQIFLHALRLLNVWLRVVGFTATPYRMGLGMITDGGIFTDVCFDISGPSGFADLLRDDYIAMLIPKRTKLLLDVSNVRVSRATGDFSESDVQKAVDKDEITHAALSEACELAHNRYSWLVFTAGIEHAEHCAAKLESFGVPALAIHSKLAPKVRRERFAMFKAGKVRAICGNRLFTTGFNHKPVDFIADLMPTMSTALHVQKMGRGTRPFAGNNIFPPKENCLVADYAGNTGRLGPIDDPKIPRKKGEGNGDPPCCICSACGTYNHARAVICICCGAEIHHEVKISASSGTAALMQADAPQFEWFPVLYWTATRHSKIGAPDSLLVTYASGLRRFNKWVTVERTGFAGKQAREWWRAASKQDDPPTSVTEALERFKTLNTPRWIRVWINKKYPEIVGESWSETEPHN